MSGNHKIDVSTAVYSDVGNVRKANEDSYYVAPDERLLIVCDGMGGQVAGGLASKIAVETIKDAHDNLSEAQVDYFFPKGDSSLTLASRRLVVAVRLANRRLYMMTTRFAKLRGMGTTVVALGLSDICATMVHVGDSRIFRMSGKNILQLTEDHSWLNELIEDNEINEEQIETFQQKNVITRALGISPAVKIDIHCEKYKADDYYVLSTDGLHNSVHASDIRKMIERSKSRDLDLIVKKLIEKAKQRDGTDNITVAMARLNRDCRMSKLLGISASIPEEDERQVAKEDKYVQEKYSEPKMNIKEVVPAAGMSGSNKKLLIGVAIVTGILCFLLGLALKRSRSTPETPAYLESRRASSQVLAQNHPTALQPGGRSSNGSRAQLNTTEAISKSSLARDAVVAVVLFNSKADYERAQLEKRGKVIDQIQPYLNSNIDIDGVFSIFLIDGDNNVIHKTSGIDFSDSP
jgi:protein phosphatase